MSDSEKAVWLTRKEACQFLASLGYRVSPERLANLAMNNNAAGGPPFCRYGAKVIRYEQSKVRKWLEQRTEHVA